jgi:integrase
MPLLTRPELYKYLADNRPGNKPKTIKTNEGMIYAIWKMTHPESEWDRVDTDWFRQNPDVIIDVVKDKSPGARASYMSAVSSMINSREETIALRTAMISDAKKRDAFQESGEMTETEKANWMEYPDIVDIWNRHYKDFKITVQKSTLTQADKKALTEFIIFTISAGIFFPPRRAEWVLVKFRNFNEETDNYLDLPHNRFVLNDYKTAKTMGRQMISFPDEFKLILTKFIEKVPLRGTSDYFINNYQGTPLSQSSFTQTLWKVFGGKHVSVTMLRHIYKSHLYGEVPALKSLRTDAEQMGHSLIMSLKYIKKTT